MDKTRRPQAALRIFVIGLTVFGMSPTHLGVAQEETRIATRPSLQFGKNNWPLRANLGNAEAKGETVQQPGIFRGGLVQQLRSITSSVLGDDASAEEVELEPTEIKDNETEATAEDTESPSSKDMVDAPAYSDEEMDEADLDQPIPDSPELTSPDTKVSSSKPIDVPEDDIDAENLDEPAAPAMPLPLVPGQSRWRNQPTAPLMDPPALSRKATQKTASPSRSSAPTTRSSAPAVGTGTRSTNPANPQPTTNNQPTTSRPTSNKTPSTAQVNNNGSNTVPTPPTSIPKPPTALKSPAPQGKNAIPVGETDKTAGDAKKAAPTQTTNLPSKTNSSRKSVTANKSTAGTTLPTANVTELEEGRLKVSDRAPLTSADATAPSPETGPVVSKKLPPNKSKPSKTTTPTLTGTASETSQNKETSETSASTAEQTSSTVDSAIKSSTTSPPEIVASGSPDDKEQKTTTPQVKLDNEKTTTPSTGDNPETTSASQTKLIDMEIPSVLVRLSGPSDIPVGRKGDYELITKNTGTIPLNGVIVRMDIPKGVTAELTPEAKDSAQIEKMEDDSVAILWQVSELTPNQSQKLPVKLTASEARNFAIAMEWTVLPQNGQMQVNVLKPALQIGLEGPAEVNYGAPQMYRLKVSNPGTAPAENVVLNMTAEPYGSNSSPLGTIPAGSHRVIEVELTFQQRGKLKIKAEAVATDLKTSSEIDVLVRQAMLEASVSGVESEYVGATGSYEFKLSNSGDTAAENVAAQVELPEGVKLNQLPSGARLSGRNLLWEINQLTAGQELKLGFETEYLAAGEKLFQVTCRGSAGASVVTQTKTLVEAVADLKLTLSDPPSPSPIGEEVVYELEIVNRGKQSANNVKIIAQFSEGIEPSSAIGSEHKIVPGQVLFEPIQTIAAGDSVKLQVRALASQAGVHRFRVEVQTDDEEIHHVLEESTRYTQTAARPTGTKLR